jgi:hypothetical protein
VLDSFHRRGSVRQGRVRRSIKVLVDPIPFTVEPKRGRRRGSSPLDAAFGVGAWLDGPVGEYHCDVFMYQIYYKLPLF